MRMHVQDHIGVHAPLHLHQNVQDPIFPDAQGSDSLTFQVRGPKEAHIRYAAERCASVWFPPGQE